MSRFRRITAASAISVMVAGFLIGVAAPASASTDRPSVNALICQALANAEKALAASKLPDKLKQYLEEQIDQAQARNHCS